MSTEPKRIIQAPPDRLIENGEVHYGLFRVPLRAPNLLAAPGLPGWARPWRLKEWQHWGLIHPDFYVSLAVVDSKYLGTAWISVFDRHTRMVFEHSRKVPLRTPKLPPDLYDGGVSWSVSGLHVDIRNELDRGWHRISFNAPARGDRPAVRGEIVAEQDMNRIPPLVACLPLGPGRPFYSHKAPCPLSGSLTIGSRTVAFEPGRDFGLLDEHKAFYPRQTFWRWATFATRDRDGRVLGVNLTHNVIADDEHNNENVLWCNDRILPLGAARFVIGMTPDAPWQVRTLDGCVDLTFEPQGARSEDLDVVVAMSRFRQPVGLFRGTLVDGDGQRHDVSDALGVVEDHRVAW